MRHDVLLSPEPRTFRSPQLESVARVLAWCRYVVQGEVTVKVAKALVGRYVEMVWLDPVGARRVETHQALKGRAGLATWTERGVIDDITEDVVRVVHSEGRSPSSTEVDELTYTMIPEDLIISLRTFILETP